MASIKKSEVEKKVELALEALKEYESNPVYDQGHIDYIVKKCSVAGIDQHLVLAEDAYNETKRGVIEDKAIKNIFSCEEVTRYLNGQKTVGIIEDDDINGLVKIAAPVGVIAGITPVTNPTSTTIFKCLISIKTRNPIIFAFHPNAQNSSVKAAQVIYDAAIKAGAPKNCIQWIEKPSLDATNELIGNPGVATILATGGNAMVKAAYSQGKPALGVGAGNVPVYIEKTANLKTAANDIVMSKNFDNGMICASEQVIIIDESIYKQTIKEFEKLHAYVLKPEEKKKLEVFVFGVAAGKDCSGHQLNAAIVGQSAEWIAEQAGFKVPEGTSLLLGEMKSIGKMEPLSAEKLSPILGIIKAKDSQQAFDYAEKTLENGGLGHSAGIHTAKKDLANQYGVRMKACRILWNQPTSFGGIGDLYNALMPSLTLGCGSYGHNSVSGNIGAFNLLNIKQVARRNNNMQWFKVPPKIYIEPNAIRYLKDLENAERVVIITDKMMNELGYVKRVRQELGMRSEPVITSVIDYIEPEPSVETIKKGVDDLNDFKPDTIIALGGGSPMDAAKVIRLMYEHPEIDFADVREKFLDIRKRAFRLPTENTKTKLVCIPTTSGTGSEVTPFAVITDKATGFKYPLADYILTPDIAIVDPVLAEGQPRRLALDSGFDALTHAVESYTSVYANDFTDSDAQNAFHLIYKYLPRSVDEKLNIADSKRAKYKMHNAATIAGMAFASAFLGLCHAMAHTIGALFHISHGRTNAILLPWVIRYNGVIPSKPTNWPKYDHYKAPQRFQDLLTVIGKPIQDELKAGEKLAEVIEKLRKDLGVENSFQEIGVDEKEFIKSLDKIAHRSYEDQTTAANPRVPMLNDIKKIALQAYYGNKEGSPEVVGKKSAKKS